MIDEVVEEKEWIIETDVKMEILLLFGMMYTYGLFDGRR